MLYCRMISIRPALEADSALILQLINDLAEYEKLSHIVVADIQKISETLFGEKPSAEVLIAEYEDYPAGFALFFSNYSTFLAKPGFYLEDLYVKPELRGKGIGKALLSKIAQLAVERNYGRVEWSVLDWNEPAIGFYKKIGAKAMDEWTVFRLSGEELLSFGKIASH